jgi:hypothetical protein
LSEEHFKKHSIPNLVTDEGILIEVRDLHREKHPSLISMIDEGSMIDSREEHPQK